MRCSVRRYKTGPSPLRVKKRNLGREVLKRLGRPPRIASVWEKSRLKRDVVVADAWHHRSDAITSAAAALGISIALVGGERYAAADEWAAMFAAVIIALNGWRLLRPTIPSIKKRLT